MKHAGQPCPACGLVAPPPNREDFAKYFAGDEWSCTCGHKETLWSRLLHAMQDDSRFAVGIIALGLAEATFLSISLQRDTPMLVDLTQRGVPGDATILDVFLTPISRGAGSAGLVPALGVQNLSRQHVPHVFPVYPVEYSYEGNEDGSEATLMVIWLSPTIEPELVSLASAAHAFGTGDYRSVIIPANVAVEAKLNRVLSAHYSQYARKGDVNSFLIQGATYGHQLRFLWPSLFSLAGAPALDSDEIVPRLLKLNKLRNAVAHSHEEVERDVAAELLLAALFGYRYLSEFGEWITSASSDESTGFD